MAQPGDPRFGPGGESLNPRRGGGRQAPAGEAWEQPVDWRKALPGLEDVQAAQRARKKKRDAYGDETRMWMDENFVLAPRGVGASTKDPRVKSVASMKSSYRHSGGEETAGYNMAALAGADPRRFRRVAHELGMDEATLREAMMQQLMIMYQQP